MNIQEAFVKLRDDLKAWATTNLQELAKHWVPNTRKINNKSLDKDITLTADDIGVGDDLSMLKEQILTGNVNVYVSTSGSDTTGDGTESNPWKTITKAVQHAPIARPSYDDFITYTINVAGGTYNENIKIYEKKVTINLLGGVTVKPLNPNVATFSICNGARVNIHSKTFNTHLNIYGSTGFSVTSMSFMMMHDLIDLRFIDISKRCFYCEDSSHIELIFTDDNNKAVEQITIHSNEIKTMDSIIQAKNNSFVLINTKYFVFDTESTCEHYVFNSSFNSYIYVYSNAAGTIPPNYSKGISATHFGIVDIQNITLSDGVSTQVNTGGSVTPN